MSSAIFICSLLLVPTDTLPANSERSKRSVGNSTSAESGKTSVSDRNLTSTANQTSSVTPPMQEPARCEVMCCCERTGWRYRRRGRYCWREVDEECLRCRKGGHWWYHEYLMCPCYCDDRPNPTTDKHKQNTTTAKTTTPGTSTNKSTATSTTITTTRKDRSWRYMEVTIVFGGLGGLIMVAACWFYWSKKCFGHTCLDSENENEVLETSSGEEYDLETFDAEELVEKAKWEWTQERQIRCERAMDSTFGAPVNRTRIKVKYKREEKMNGDIQDGSEGDKEPTNKEQDYVDIDIHDVNLTEDQIQTRSSQPCVSTDATSCSTDKGLQGDIIIEVENPVYGLLESKDSGTIHTDPRNGKKKKGLKWVHAIGLRRACPVSDGSVNDQAKETNPKTGMKNEYAYIDSPNDDIRGKGKEKASSRQVKEETCLPSSSVEENLYEEINEVKAKVDHPHQQVLQTSAQKLESTLHDKPKAKEINSKTRKKKHAANIDSPNNGMRGKGKGKAKQPQAQEETSLSSSYVEPHVYQVANDVKAKEDHLRQQACPTSAAKHDSSLDDKPVTSKIKKTNGKLHQVYQNLNEEPDAVGKEIKEPKI